jgi:hypothetical protein
VPVYFHSIVKVDGTGKVPPSQITAQLSALNVAFSGTLSGNGASDTSFRFELAGVTETVNDNWFQAAPHSEADLEMKTSLREGGCNTLNIFSRGLLEQGGTLGFSSFAWECEAGPEFDAVEIDFRTLPGGTAAPYNLGFSAVHETGHWLGLLHTFERGCRFINSLVEASDTPRHSEPTLGCPVSADTCPSHGTDPVHNFMNYEDDACMSEFTPDQGLRAREMYSEFRQD